MTIVLAMVVTHSLELVRLCNSQHIGSDMYMTAMSSEGAVSAKPRTVALNEELGQIRFIFSDKTGTLTQVTQLFVFRSATNIKVALFAVYNRFYSFT